MYCFYSCQAVASRSGSLRRVVAAIIFGSARPTKCERTVGMGCHLAGKVLQFLGLFLLRVLHLENIHCKRLRHTNREKKRSVFDKNLNQFFLWKRINSLYIQYHCLQSTINIVFDRVGKKDPVTKGIEIAVHWIGFNIDVTFWSQHISFYLVGCIVVTSIRGLLLSLTKVRKKLYTLYIPLMQLHIFIH